jgi:hypothetical protein
VNLATSIVPVDFVADKLCTLTQLELAFATACGAIALVRHRSRRARSTASYVAKAIVGSLRPPSQKQS